MREIVEDFQEELRKWRINESFIPDRLLTNIKNKHPDWSDEQIRQHAQEIMSSKKTSQKKTGDDHSNAEQQTVKTQLPQEFKDFSHALDRLQDARKNFRYWDGRCEDLVDRRVGKYGGGNTQYVDKKMEQAEEQLNTAQDSFNSVVGELKSKFSDIFTQTGMDPKRFGCKNVVLDGIAYYTFRDQAGNVIFVGTDGVVAEGTQKPVSEDQGSKIWDDMKKNASRVEKLSALI